MAVAVDTPEQSARVVTRNRLPFAILSDPDRSMVKAYGVLHAGGAPDGSDIALPAHFLIERDGTIAWKYVSTRATDRVDPAELLAQVKKLQN